MPLLAGHVLALVLCLRGPLQRAHSAPPAQDQGLDLDLGHGLGPGPHGATQAVHAVATEDEDLHHAHVVLVETDGQLNEGSTTDNSN